jgi:hypothetical protein
VPFSATVTSATNDPNPGNNTLSATTTVTAAAQVASIPTLSPVALVVLSGLLLIVALRRRT